LPALCSLHPARALAHASSPSHPALQPRAAPRPPPPALPAWPRPASCCSWTTPPPGPQPRTAPRPSSPSPGALPQAGARRSGQARGGEGNTARRAWKGAPGAWLSRRTHRPCPAVRCPKAAPSAGRPVFACAPAPPGAPGGSSCTRDHGRRAGAVPWQVVSARWCEAQVGRPSQPPSAALRCADAPPAQRRRQSCQMCSRCIEAILRQAPSSGVGASPAKAAS
jgi:hypothetical protein